MSMESPQFATFFSSVRDICYDNDKQPFIIVDFLTRFYIIGDPNRVKRIAEEKHCLSDVNQLIALEIKI